MPRSSRIPGDAEALHATRTDHGISPQAIHPNVHFVCQRLREHGHSALLVGGAVRDLLLGRAPKDFDLATSARPEAVKQLFRNARVIGRRFRLVLLHYPNMTIEVATFRAEPRDGHGGMIRRDNRYGTVEQDARRRDFTINALTLDPLGMTLYDYVDGEADLRAGRIRTIKPPHASFMEDPVRMLRAVRFQVRLGFRLDAQCEAVLRKMAPQLGAVKRHRLADVIQRFLTDGYAQQTWGAFHHLGLLVPLLALDAHPWFFPPPVREQPLEALAPYLAAVDRWAARGTEPLPPTVALLGLLVSLGPPAWQEMLAGRKAADETQFLRRLPGRLAELLATWGMLNGQVSPAMQILTALRTLSTSPALLHDRSAAASIPGAREAIMLCALLRERFAVSEAAVAQGLAALPDLPDLPILDHPRPLNRALTAHAHPHGHRAGAGRRRSGRRRRGKAARS